MRLRSPFATKQERRILRVLNEDFVAGLDMWHLGLFFLIKHCGKRRAYTLLKKYGASRPAPIFRVGTQIDY